MIVRNRRSLFGLTTAAVLLAMLSTFAPAAAATTLGQFELDGNLVDSNALDDIYDWDTLPGAIIFSDPSGNQADNVFQGSKEFEPFNWTFDPDGSAPQKADIVQAGIGQRKIGSDDWLYLFFERAGNNGDVFLNFEFNRSDATYVNSTGSTVPVRTAGDLLVAFFVTKGGTKTEIDVFQWQGDHRFGQWVHPTVDPIPLRGTDWDAVTNAGANGRFTLGEAALRLQAFDQTPSCPGFGKAWVKSTSSQEFDTAALQDRTDRKDVNLSNCAVKDWEFTFDPQPIAGATVYAVYTVQGESTARQLQLTDADQDGTFTATDDSIVPGSVSYHFEVRSGDDLIWRSDHDALTPGKQDGTESFTSFEQKTNTGSLAYTVDLSPASAENVAADDHELTATVTDGAGDPLPFVTVSFENLGSCGSLSPASATTDADGEATTILTSATACTTQVRAFVNGAQAGATAGFDSGEANDTASKEFAVYQLAVTPDGDVNEIDTDHTFTVTLTRDVGEGPVGVSGASVDLALDPNSAGATITHVNGTAVTPQPATTASCTTQADGSCSVVIRGADAGDVTLTASTDVVNDSGTTTFTSSADKEYRDFRLRIDGGDQTNEVGTEHTFTVALEQDGGDGFEPLAGETVQLDLDPDDTDARIISVNGTTLDPAATTASCTTDAGGLCEVVITKPTAGSVTLNASWGTTLDSGQVTRTASAGKEYVDFVLAIDGGGATNEVGTDHTFTVSLTSFTGEGSSAVAGEVVDLTIDQGNTDATFVSVNGVPASGTTASCTTDTNGQCTVVVTSSEPGSLTLNASWDTLLDSGTATRTAAAGKSYVDYRLLVDGGGQTNEVGEPHTFTVTLEEDTGSGFAGLIGETVDLSWDGPGGIVAVNGSTIDPPVAATTCVTDAGGQCTVTVNADDPGTGTLAASWGTELDSGTVTRSGTADKDYVDFRLQILGGGQTNEIGAEHEFTVVLERDTGEGFAGIAGETVSLDLDPDDTDARIVEVNGSDLDPATTETTCVTADDGTCSVVVNKPTPGTIDLNATWTTELDSGTVTRTASADKTYGDITLTVDGGDQTNEVGTEHTFTVNLSSDTGDGAQPLAGRTVELSLQPADTDARIVRVNGNELDPAASTTTCTTDENGQCTVVIVKDTPGSVTLRATYEQELDSGTVTRTAEADKDYVDFALTVDGGGQTNEVGSPHTFTVTLTTDTGDGPTPLAGETVDLDWAGPGSITAVNGTSIDPSDTATCTTDTNGQCTVEVNSDAPGSGTLTATWSTELDSGTATRSDSADKQYVDFALVVDGGGATNEVGSPHTFTVTLTRDLGDGSAPLSGETVDLTWSGPGGIVEVNGEAVDPPSGTSSCTTDENGQCSVVVNSTSAGTGTLTASWEGELSSGTATRSASAEKSYEDFDLTVDGGGATNEVGSVHTFTVTLTRDTGSGFAGYAGQTVDLTWSGPGGIVAVGSTPVSPPASSATCTTDENGQCTVAVNSGTPGSGTLSASWSTELDSGTVTRTDSAGKDYVDFALDVDPDTAINEPGQEHEFTVTLTRDAGEGSTGYEGQTVTLTLDPNEPDARIIRVNGEEIEPATTATCTTDVNGQCSVVIVADGTGRVVLNAAWETELDSGTAGRTASAEKFYLATFVDKEVVCPVGDNVAPGGYLEFRVTYGGEGTTMANATLTDELPEQFQYQSATPEPTSAPAEGESGTVVWEFGDLPSGTTGTVIIRGTIDPEAEPGSEAVNTATFHVDGVSDKVDTTTTTVSPDRVSGARAYGLRVEALGSERIPPTPDSDQENPDSVLTLGAPVPDDLARVEVLSVQEGQDDEATATRTNAIATTAAVRVLDQDAGPGRDWLVTADAIRAVSSSFADIGNAGSSRAGSVLTNVTVAGQNIGTVSEPTTIEVTDPVLGTTASVKLLETIATGAADGVVQPDGDLFHSGLTVNAIHVSVTNATGDTIADVIVAHAESSAQFRSGLPCVPLPSVSGTGFVVATTADEQLLDPDNVLHNGEVARVMIPSTGGEDSATLEHTGPLSVGGTHVLETNAAFARSIGTVDADANDAVADTEAQVEALRLFGQADAPDEYLVRADLVRTEVHAEATDDQTASASGDTTLVGLLIDDTDVCATLGLEPACTPEPNTALDVGGVLLVILNEQILGPSGPGVASITVNAIHIYVLGEDNPLGLPVGAEIIISSSHAGAHAAGGEVLDDGDEEGAVETLRVPQAPSAGASSAPTRPAPSGSAPVRPVPEAVTPAAPKIVVPLLEQQDGPDPETDAAASSQTDSSGGLFGGLLGLF